MNSNERPFPPKIKINIYIFLLGGAPKKKQQQQIPTHPSGSSLGSYGMACEMPVASVTVGPDPPRSLEMREMTIWPRTVSVSSELWRCRSRRWTETDRCGTLMRRRNLMTAMLGRPGMERVEISSTIHPGWGGCTRRSARQRESKRGGGTGREDAAVWKVRGS